MKTCFDLFCGGVGAWSKGFDAVGIKTTHAAEKNEDRRTIFSSNFPSVKMHQDVEDLIHVKKKPWAIVGSPPCKNTSLAGQAFGKRTGETLWPRMLKVCDHFHPEWVVVEQPPGNKEWETKVARSLQKIGYHTARAKFSAADLGAPHIRRRVFILANADYSRLEVAWSRIPQIIDECRKRRGSHRSPWLPTSPRFLRVVYGSPAGLDPKERIKRIEMIGDSFPPIMAEVIGRALLS